VHTVPSGRALSPAVYPQVPTTGAIEKSSLRSPRLRMRSFSLVAEPRTSRRLRWGMHVSPSVHSLVTRHGLLVGVGHSKLDGSDVDGEVGSSRRLVGGGGGTRLLLIARSAQSLGRR